MLVWAVVVLDRVHVACLPVGAWYGDSVWEASILGVAGVSPLAWEFRIEEVRQFVGREVTGFFVVVCGGPVACWCLVFGPSGDVCSCCGSHASFPSRWLRRLPRT